MNDCNAAMPGIDRRSVLAGLGAGSAAAVLAPGIAFSATVPDALGLTAGASDAPLLGAGAPRTPIWAYDGVCPGPTIRAVQGGEVHVRLHNTLDQPTTIHWHGVRIDNAMDGVAGLTQDPVPPGGTFDYRFRVPDAGTYWYHPHNRSWEQMARGLYGVLIVDERAPPDVDADVVLVLDDWRLTEGGAIDEASFGHMHDLSHAGRLGNWITVNGVSEPRLDVPAGGLARLRLINTCNARVLGVRVPFETAWTVALDGQPIAPKPLTQEHLVLAPAQRADLIVAVPAAAGEDHALLVDDGDAGLVIARFAVTDASVARPDPQSPPRLAPNPLPTGFDRSQAKRVPLVMTGGAMGGMAEAVLDGETLDIRTLAGRGKVWAFNGVVGMTEKPLFRARRGETVIIEMGNDTAWPHAMHVHGHHFTVVDRDGAAVTSAPWRDTELVQRRERVAIGFVADNPGKWMIHCHMLEHQAAGMATWFEVGI